MSKSLGNFITLEEALARWGADAVRFAIADAGDGLEDANFERETADAAILRLTTEQEWAAETAAAAARGDLRTGELQVRRARHETTGWGSQRIRVGANPPTSLSVSQYADRVFDAKIDVAIAAAGAAYAGMRFRDAVQVRRRGSAC